MFKIEIEKSKGISVQEFKTQIYKKEKNSKSSSRSEISSIPN